MARDYINSMTPLIAADNQREARRVVVAFQNKVVKYLESTLGPADSADQTRIRLATYTASRSAIDDLNKMRCVLRARDALAGFGDALPADIQNFDDARVADATALLDEIGRTNAGTVTFALALLAGRLATPWQLIRLATKVAASKDTADIAATRYAITVSMVRLAGGQTVGATHRAARRPGRDRKGNTCFRLRRRIRLAAAHRRARSVGPGRTTASFDG